MFLFVSNVFCEHVGGPRSMVCDQYITILPTQSMEYLRQRDIFGLDSSNTSIVVPPKGWLYGILNQTIWTYYRPFCTSIVSIEMSTDPGMWSMHWESIHTNRGVPKRTSIVLYYELPIYMCLWAYRMPGNPERLSMYWESTHKEHRAPKRGGLIWMERQRKLATIEVGFILWCVKPLCVDAFLYSSYLTNLVCYQYIGKPTHSYHWLTKQKG